MIPHTFEQWKDCIVNDCKIDLNSAFARGRLTVYQNQTHPETQKFRSLYGEEHLQNIIHWFSRICAE